MRSVEYLKKCISVLFVLISTGSLLAFMFIDFKIPFVYTCIILTSLILTVMTSIFTFLHCILFNSEKKNHNEIYNIHYAEL